MSKSKSKRKKKRRRGRPTRRKGGLLLGMRSGFKNVAGAVTGTGEAKKKKNSWIGTAIAVVVIAALAALLYAR